MIKILKTVMVVVLHAKLKKGMFVNMMLINTKVYAILNAPIYVKTAASTS